MDDDLEFEWATFDPDTLDPDRREAFDAAREKTAERIRRIVWSGEITREQIREAVEYDHGVAMDDVLDLDDGEPDDAWLSSTIEQAAAEKQVEERSWPETLDTDRLDAAFDALRERRVICVAAGTPAWTTGDGWEEAYETWLANGAEDSDTEGYCFYTMEDIANGWDSATLEVGFSAVQGADPGRAVKIGRRVERRLQLAGLTPEWNGAADSTVIQLTGFRAVRRGLPA